MAELERKVFIVFYLDNQLRLPAPEAVFTGSINHTEVYLREIGAET